MITNYDFFCKLFRKYKNVVGTLVYLSREISSGPDHIKSIKQFCPCTSQQYFQHTSK